MKTFLQKIGLETKRQFELVVVTEQVLSAVTASNITNGIVLVYSPHTTASIRLNHNEPLLLQDIMKMLYRLAPLEMSYGHDLFEVRQKVALNERSNGHSHVKSFLLGSSETLSLDDGKLLIGEKQSLFFVEFDGGRARNFFVKVIGE